MGVEELVKLAKKVSEGVDDFENGAVGSNGYGFVFKDSNSGLPYVKFVWSSELCHIGAHRTFLESLMKRLKDIKTLQDFISCRDYEEKFDMLLLGALKTLVPTLQFRSEDGESDSFFDAWMFVRTPDGRQFPATLYYKKGTVAIGCWKSLKSINSFCKTTNTPVSEWIDEERINELIGKAYFPKDFMEVVNYSPFEFSEEELNIFIDTLEFALGKVPVSDFWGFHYEDTCLLSLGVHKKKPFIDRFEYPEKKYLEYEKNLKPILGKQFLNEWGTVFTIHKLPKMGLYHIKEGLYHKNEGWLNNFGSAKKIYEEYKKNKVEKEEIQVPIDIIKKLKKKYQIDGHSDDIYLSEHISWILKILLEKIEENNEFNIPEGGKRTSIEDGVNRLIQYLKRTGFYKLN